MRNDEYIPIDKKLSCSEIVGSNPTFALIWGYSSAGRAPALQAGGQRFDPAYLHHIIIGSRFANNDVAFGNYYADNLHYTYGNDN